MNPVLIVVMGAQKSLDEVEVPGGLGNREKRREFFLNWNRKLPCNEERSERSERDFTVEKSMGEVWLFLR